MSDYLPHLNAVLNSTAAVLLVVGYVLIRQRREQAHKRVMLTAFGVSIAFLISYLAYHVWPFGVGETKFQGQGLIRPVYFTILITHIVLAGGVAVLAIAHIILGYRDRVGAHRPWAWGACACWVRCSVTGGGVYFLF